MLWKDILKIFFSCYPLQTIVLKKESLLLAGMDLKDFASLSLQFPLSGQSKQMFCVFLAGSCAAPTTVAFYRYSHLLPRVLGWLLSLARGPSNIQELRASHQNLCSCASHDFLTLYFYIWSPGYFIHINPSSASAHLSSPAQTICFNCVFSWLHTSIWLTENFTVLYSFRNILYLSNIFFPLCP